MTQKTKDDKKNAASRIDDIDNIELPEAERAFEEARAALHLLRQEKDDLLRFIGTP